MRGSDVGWKAVPFFVVGEIILFFAAPKILSRDFL
jgi:hypothetical protein